VTSCWTHHYGCLRQANLFSLRAAGCSFCDGSRPRHTNSGATDRREGVEAQRFGLQTGRRLTTAWRLPYSFVCSTPPPERGDDNSLEKNDSRQPGTHRPGHHNSPTAASFLRRDVTIRKNIIGRAVTVVAARFGRDIRFLSARPGVPDAQSASAPAWQRNFPRPRNPATARFLSANWRRDSTARAHNFAARCAKR
jgi:hypothetical protein